MASVPGTVLYYNFAGGKVSRKILNGFYGKQLLHEKNKNLNFKKIQVSIFWCQ